MIFDCTTSEVGHRHERAVTSIPGVPLINGVIDIVEGHVLIGMQPA